MDVRLTITGADDNVDIEDLKRLSAENPFVEWGALCSAKRAGTPRYPSHAWLQRLANSGVPASLHLCGSALLDRPEDGQEHDDDFPSWRSLSCGRMRIQINDKLSTDRLETIACCCESIILQCPSEDVLTDVYQQAKDLCRWFQRGAAEVLIDASRGTGKRPVSWPDVSCLLGVRFGFAGGIKPESISATVHEISLVNHHALKSFWIDMESSVRRDDVFDMALVKQAIGEVRSLLARKT